MIDFIEIIRSGLELIHSKKETQEARQALLNTPNNEYEFFEKKPIKKAFFAASFIYISNNIYLFSMQIAELSVSNPHQIAILAMCTPPVLSTILLAFATAYNLVSLIKKGMEKNPHPPGSPEFTEWGRNKKSEMLAKAVLLGMSITFLAASVAPIPGASNILGSTALAVFLTVAVVQYAVKEIGQYVKNEQNKGNMKPISTFLSNNFEKLHFGSPVYNQAISLTASVHKNYQSLIINSYQKMPTITPMPLASLETLPRPSLHMK